MNRSLISGLVFTAFIAACRFCRPLADFYATRIYPSVSIILSWISSPVRFSLQNIAIAALVTIAISLIVLAVKKHWGWKRCLLHEANLLIWTFVWFYMGWCLNYSRSSIFQRLDIEAHQYDSTVFEAFIDDLTPLINSSYVSETEISEDLIESEIKEFYALVPEEFGLCKPKGWQHSKRIFPESIFTSTGILGYIGPLFSEFHINGNILPEELPFTWAHEYSHLLGVSNEDEANWWAWNACMNSSVPAIRYSACLSILGYVMTNASGVMSEDKFNEWVSTINPEVVSDYRRIYDFWKSHKKPRLTRIQKKTYDLFLKGNKIPSGINNYAGVVRLMISIGPVKVQRPD